LNRSEGQGTRLLIQVPLYSRALARVIQDRTWEERTELQEACFTATAVSDLLQRPPIVHSRASTGRGRLWPLIEPHPSFA
jgi:hypothetical protein